MDGQSSQADELPSKGAKLNRALRTAAAVAIIIAAIWALFRWVITDPLTTLDYIKALVWPIVILAVVAWLRQPIRAKLAALLKVSGFGVDAEFTDAGRALQDEVGPDVEALRPHDVDFVGIFETALREGEPPAHAIDSSESGQGSSSEHPAQSPCDMDRTTTGVETAGEEPGALTEKHIDDLLDVLRGLGVTEAALRQAETELRSSQADRTRHEVVRLTETIVKERIDLWNAQQREREDLTQQSIESIIRKSASWGYDLGKSGAPPTTPDIEWSSDGTWHITTDIPRKPGDSTTRVSVAESNRLRHIRSLEDEIKARESSGPFTAAGFDPYLMELKSRLRAIDPRNPWESGAGGLSV